MTNHECGLEEAGACGGPPAKLHHLKEEFEWLGNVSICEEALAVAQTEGEGRGYGRKNPQCNVHLGKLLSQEMGASCR